jgi:hypothetical protein
MILIRQQRLTAFHSLTELKAKPLHRPYSIGELDGQPVSLSNRHSQLPTATLKAQRAFLGDLCINVEAASGLRPNRSPVMQRF